MVAAPSRLQPVSPYGDQVPRPQNPIKEAYTFNGWYKDPAFTQLWDFNEDLVDGDRTLYAGWISILPPITSQTSAVSPSVQPTGREVPSSVQPTDSPFTDPHGTDPGQIGTCSSICCCKADYHPHPAHILTFTLGLITLILVVFGVGFLQYRRIRLADDLADISEDGEKRTSSNRWLLLLLSALFLIAAIFVAYFLLLGILSPWTFHQIGLDGSPCYGTCNWMTDEIHHDAIVHWAADYRSPSCGDECTCVPPSFIQQHIFHYLLQLLFLAAGIVSLVFLLRLFRRRTVTFLLLTADGVKEYPIRVWYNTRVSIDDLPDSIFHQTWYLYPQRQEPWIFEEDTVIEDIILYPGY
jgi:uncharacterized repeat protein (TIGR02543 family)